LVKASGIVKEKLTFPFLSVLNCGKKKAVSLKLVRALIPSKDIFPTDSVSSVSVDSITVSSTSSSTSSTSIICTPAVLPCKAVITFVDFFLF